jgi:heme-degrading monooxygenase HmoA
MFAVIFEVVPKSDRWDEYLGLGRLLKPEVEAIDGFLDNERFESQRTEGRVLSLSTWRDEKALIRWRTHAAHHAVQEKGRFAVFADYRLRVAEVVADSHVPPGLTVRQQRLDETEVGDARCVTLSEVPGAAGRPASVDLAGALGMPAAGAGGLVDREVFESLYNPGKLLLLGAWSDAGAAEAWVPRAPASGTLRHRRVRIVRDYGMRDRREAPQFYPEVEPPPRTG